MFTLMSIRIKTAWSWTVSGEKTEAWLSLGENSFPHCFSSTNAAQLYLVAQWLFFLSCKLCTQRISYCTWRHWSYLQVIKPPSYLCKVTWHIFHQLHYTKKEYRETRNSWVLFNPTSLDKYKNWIWRKKSYTKCVHKVLRLKVYLPRQKWSINETFIFFKISRLGTQHTFPVSFLLVRAS